MVTTGTAGGQYAHGIAAHLDDAEMVASAQSGDRAALDHLLRRHYDNIHRVCRRIAGSSRDADDACQEAMIKIVRSLPRFDGRSSFGTWAYRIATNAALDEIRKRNRRPALHTVGSDTASDVTDVRAEQRVESVVDRNAIDEALAELPNDFRTAVVLRDVIDLDYGEIAEILEIPIGTVKSRIARGRRMLGEHLRRPESLDIGNPRAPDERPTDST